MQGRWIVERSLGLSLTAPLLVAISGLPAIAQHRHPGGTQLPIHQPSGQAGVHAPPGSYTPAARAPMTPRTYDAGVPQYGEPQAPGVGVEAAPPIGDVAPEEIPGPPAIPAPEVGSDAVVPSPDVGRALDDVIGQPAAPATTPVSSTPAPAAPPAGGPAFSPELFAATGGDEFAIADVGGYIDGAIPRSRVRFRYDTAYDLRDPSRAEFFYPKCGCFLLFGGDATARGPVQGLPNLFVNRNGRLELFRREDVPMNPDGTFRRDPATGLIVFPEGSRPILLGTENDIDFQEYTTTVEYAPTPRFSAFLDVPVRWINGSVIDNAGGFSDLRPGFKYALVASPDTFLTFQTKFYIPTGDPGRGLGTGHPSIEPGLLLFQRLSERAFFIGELRDWIPIQASDFGGNVLRYGGGLSYNLVQTRRMRIAPVVEFVGWTVLDGKTIDLSDVPPAGDLARDAAGDTILNGKYGVRIGFGDYRRAGGASLLNDRHNFYIGYGNAYTGNHWYQDILRIEYQFYF